MTNYTMEKEEESTSGGKENTPVSGKKQVLLQWRNYQEKKKNSNDTNQEISVENFEIEAMKLSEKINQHAQRKGQDGARISSANSSQTSLVKPNRMKTRIDVQSYLIPDEEGEQSEEEQREREEQEDEDEDDKDNMWIDLDQEFNDPRSALACINLTKNGDFKAVRRRRPRKFKKIKAVRSFRGESKGKTEDDDNSLFSSDKESDNDDQRDFGRKMSSPNEYFVPDVKPFRRFFGNPGHATEDEQRASDRDRWAHNVLTVPNYRRGIPFCRPNEPSSRRSPPLEPKVSEQRFKLSPSTERAMMEFGLHGPSRESKPFAGSPPQIPESHVVQTLPNVFPRYKKEKRPIQHWHSISNEPLYEEERGLELIMGFTARLMGKAKPISGEDMVEPFHCHRPRNGDTEDNYLDGLPERGLEDPMYMCPEDPTTARGNEDVVNYLNFSDFY